ncbi:MAG: hypothetical protein FJ191_00030 [Gammaproteobacteria bacterium]|nr:hypothetical protein [Gammaproteobacteria bacterium]
MNPRVTLAAAALLCPMAAFAADPPAGLMTGAKVGLDLRLRHEAVEQAGLPADAGANTLRLRLNLATGKVNSFAAFFELDHLQVLGSDNYNSTRNGRTRYPIVADPEGTDLNQAYVEYTGLPKTAVRLGRQRIRHDGERHIGSVGWRQNEQTYDALTISNTGIPGLTLNYSYVTAVRRVFGPDSGSPPADFDSDSHLLHLRFTKLPVGALSAYFYRLDFDDAPQLSSNTVGLRYDGSRKLGAGPEITWGLEFARQQDAAASQANIDAAYRQVEIGLKWPAFGIVAGQEVLDGESGTFSALTNPAFQTPLATLHKWQGWADKFLTTPSAGIDDRYVGINGKFAGFTAQAVWHDFQAEATAQDYGTELDVSIGRKFAKRYDVLVKYADYETDGLFTDTSKFWLQVGAAF